MNPVLAFCALDLA